MHIFHRIAAALAVAPDLLHKDLSSPLQQNNKGGKSGETISSISIYLRNELLFPFLVCMQYCNKVR